MASPPSDAISALKFSPDPGSTRFVVSSWDKNVYLYELRDENGNVGEGKLLQKFEHRAPVLDVCFGATEDEIYTAGLDWDVRKCVLPGFLHFSTLRGRANTLQNRHGDVHANGS